MERMARAWIERPQRDTVENVVEDIHKAFPEAADAATVRQDWFKVAQERRAAVNLHRFTGTTPGREDDGNRNGSVDLTLMDGDGVLAIAEVTSTIDSRAERAFRMSERIVQEVQERYVGHSHWFLHFGRDYTPPPNTTLMKRFAERIAAELRALDESEAAFVSLATAPWLTAHRTWDGEGTVDGASWASRVPAGDRSVTESLRHFLHSGLVQAKVRKLRDESVRLGARERHLYVYVTPTGANAQAFPGGPWDLAGVRLGLPPGMDVLWLDTRARFTYRYTHREGVEVFANW